MISERHTASILLSRQPLRPDGSTPWVRNVVRAVNWVGQRDLTLCGSLGMQTWDMQVALAASEKLRLHLLVPATTEQEFEQTCESALNQFDMDPGRVSFAPVLPESEKATGADLMALRDRSVVEQAECLIPLSVRDNGGMANLIRQAEACGAKVDTRFKTEYKKRNDKLAYEIPVENIRPELKSVARDYLIHWTRTPNSAWPDERLIDYYLAIAQSESYPRSAFDTLCHVLNSKKIMASSRHMPGSVRTVSFSATSPCELAKLMKWRARYREMSFEPYGIGIRKDCAERMGILPVQYHDKSGKTDDQDSRWLSQSAGQIGDWRKEKEYRCKGDFSFSELPSEAVCAFAYTSVEAYGLESKSGIRTVALVD